MKITPSRIKTLLTIGESQGIEFKRAADGPKADTFESVCALLNKTGGDIFLGVEDDGEEAPSLYLPKRSSAQRLSAFRRLPAKESLSR